MIPGRPSGPSIQSREPRRSGPDAASPRVDAGAVRISSGDGAARLGLPAILGLQRAAGNRAVGQLLRERRRVSPRAPATVQAQTEAPAEAEAPSEEHIDETTGESQGPIHPVLRWGTRGPDVLELQTKLNQAGADPQLGLDGAFGALTAKAVGAFQLGNGLVTDGIVGPKTWAALDEATVGAPDAGPTGEAGGSPESPTDTGVGTTDTGEGNPQGRAEGSVHPVLTPGFTGSAASELQHKLNGAVFFAFPVIPVTGVYDPFTVSAVSAFRALNNISDPSVGPQDVGPVTWAVLDQQVPGSPVGRVEKTWSEVVGAKTYRMTSRYTYRILASPPKIQIEVRLGFSGDMTAVPKLLDAIKMTWNRFAAVRTDDAEPHEQLAIEFNPISVNASPDNSVQLLHSPDPNHPSNSDADHWFVDDTKRLSFLAAHEFGHMIGLEDEYSRGHEDFKRVVGAQPEGTPMVNAGTPAIQLHAALFMPADTTEIPVLGPIIDLFRTPEENRAAAVRKVVDNWKLATDRRGAFDVASVYDAAFGTSVGRPDLIAAIQQQLPPDRHAEFVKVFTFDSSSVMGRPSTMFADADGSLHSHPVNPRHVRQFVKFVEDFKGGAWVGTQVS